MWIDDAIGYFNPERKLERIRARRFIQRIENPRTRKYDGATKGRRGEGWHTTGLSSNAEIAQALPLLRNRSRDLVRNNPYAARGVQVIPHNVIGRGIRAAIDHKNETRENRVKDLWKSWAETTDCDYDGNHDIFGLQHLIMRSLVESGEVLVRRRRVRRSDSSIGIKLQILEADFIASHTLSNVKVASGHNVIQGIEFDSRGKRVAYHLYESHPGNSGIEETNKFDGSFRTIRVSSSDVLHVYRVERPGQVRGVPWLAPSMLRLRDFDDYEQAQLVRQKLAACYMAFIKDTNLPEDDDDEPEDVRGFEPGMVEELPPGKDIVLSDPPQVNENYADYTRVMLQAVAVGLGVSYESLTGNLKDINFSSSRMGWLEFQRNIEVWRTTIMQNQVNSPIFEWFSEGAEIEGVSMEGVSIQWIAPRREMIDPTKEVPALAKAVEAKFKTLSEVIRENGKHPEDHFEELKAEKDALDKLGLTDNTEDNTTQKSKAPVKQSNSRLGASAL